MSLHSFQWPITVYIEDTDAGGIVFYANYLRFMERARTEFIRSLGFPAVARIEPNTQFVVHKVSVTYHRPAKLDDRLNVSAQVKRLGRTFMVFEQAVTQSADNQMLVAGEVTVACVDSKRFKATRLPEALLNALRTVSS